jgi:NAD-dependent dihydropyrimidine dehydrogenase PreA subunit
MCEFCIQHGAGKKWYLESKNYAEKLAASEGRESFIKDFFKSYERNYRRDLYKIDVARKIPFVREYAEMKIQNYFTNKHAGQVVSLEDAVSICSIPGRVSVINCPCQKYITGKEKRQCILFGATADIVENLPEFSHISDIDFENAAELLKSVEIEGKIHTLWTFISPYIGAICNCDQMGCLLFHLKNRYQFAEIIRKGHEIAIIDHDICIGCGKCREICQFGGVVIVGGKAEINSNCYGCGVCRGFCPVGAIGLVPNGLF